MTWEEMSHRQLQGTLVEFSHLIIGIIVILRVHQAFEVMFWFGIGRFLCM